MADVETNWTELDSKYSNLTNSYLDWCKVVSKFEHKQREIAERYDVAQQRVSEWISIGKCENYFTGNTGKLPKSNHALYMLTTLPDDSKRDDCLTEFPNPTQTQIKEYKDGLRALEKSKVKEFVFTNKPKEVTPPKKKQKEEEVEEPALKEKWCGYEHKENKERSEQLKEALTSMLNSDPRSELFEILKESGGELQKKVLKLMKHNLHPDKDTGNKELFQRLIKIEGLFNE